ncbi:MAG: radical SAM protein [Kiritimatiellae bacterium]|nr:radical SAM protein [Kiritimatiellia bacterium]MDD5523052.1 radical SAM protein [Kiritimatiellia bacterium]
MKKKILLLSTSFEEVSLITSSADRKLEVKCTDSSHYPLGLGYLHSYLEATGHTVTSLWLNNYQYELCKRRIAETLNRFKPDIVGLQIMTANRVSSYRTIEYIHEQNPDIAIVIGGIHPTIMYRQLIEKYPFSTVVIGEGELTFAELSEKLPDTTANLFNVKGIAFKHAGNIVITEPRELINNLDLLPFPKHEAFFDPQRNYGCIITSRGCPFACSFCCLKAITRQKIRTRSISNVVDEIEFLIKTFPQIRMLFIHDDTFLLNNSRAMDFCDEIVKRQIKLEFICSSRAKPLSPELIQKLECANFTKILVGLESGDSEILSKCHKGITTNDMINACELFAKSPIEMYIFLIVGLPGETKTTILNTAHFAQRLQKIKYIFYDNVAILTVYPGTEVYEIAKRGGMISDDFWLSNKPTPLFTLENSLDQLFEYKELLLNHISMNRFFTFAGFKAQFIMLPNMFFYILRYKIPRIIIGSTSMLLQRILPYKNYEKIRSLYRTIIQKIRR